MMNELKKIAFARRLDVLDMIYKAKAGHIGGSMSCMEILVTLYYGIFDTHKIRNNAKERDRFILSKGHCAEALYSILADIGLFPKENLSAFSAFDTMFAEHPTIKVPGIEFATGALGHGLSIGTGMAIGLKADQNPSVVYVLMGDGELAEGSVWEAAMAASKYKLSNLVAIIDRNQLQISGKTEDVMPLGDLHAKFRAFGWDCQTCNGHEPTEINECITHKPIGRPLAVIAETIKGFGSTIMENKEEWHHQIPNDSAYAAIKIEMTKRRDHCG